MNRVVYGKRYHERAATAKHAVEDRQRREQRIREQTRAVHQPSLFVAVNNNSTSSLPSLSSLYESMQTKAKPSDPTTAATKTDPFWVYSKMKYASSHYHMHICFH
jgi:hypothetical protein